MNTSLPPVRTQDGSVTFDPWVKPYENHSSVTFDPWVKPHENHSFS